MVLESFFCKIMNPTTRLFTSLIVSKPSNRVSFQTICDSLSEFKTKNASLVSCSKGTRNTTLTKNRVISLTYGVVIKRASYSDVIKESSHESQRKLVSSASSLKECDLRATKNRLIDPDSSTMFPQENSSHRLGGSSGEEGPVIVS